MSEIIKEMKDGIKKHQEKLDAEVAKLQTELAEKGATIEQIQKEASDKFSTLEAELKEAKAAAARSAQGEEIDLLAGGMSSKTQEALLTASISKSIKDLPDDMLRNASKHGNIRHTQPLDFKAVGVVTTANLTGGKYQSYLPAEAGYEPMGQAHVREYFRFIQTSTGNVIYPTIATPIGEGAMAAQVEAAEKGQVDRDMTMTSKTLSFWAGYLKVSRQALEDIPFLRSYLSMSLPNQLFETEDAAWGTALWNAASAVTPTNAGNVVTILTDLRVKLITNKYGGAQGLEYFVSPDVWALLLGNQSSTGLYNVPIGITIAPNGDIRYLGIRVNVVNWLGGASRIVLVNTSKVAIAQNIGINLAVSDSDGDDFIKNRITFRIEERADPLFFRGDAILKATYVAPEPEDEE